MSDRIALAYNASGDIKQKAIRVFLSAVSYVGRWQWDFAGFARDMVRWLRWLFPAFSRMAPMLPAEPPNPTMGMSW
jgi:hypothetical protein